MTPTNPLRLRLCQAQPSLEAIQAVPRRKWDTVSQAGLSIDDLDDSTAFQELRNACNHVAADSRLVVLVML